jgi:hypothetical protein
MGVLMHVPAAITEQNASKNAAKQAAKPTTHAQSMVRPKEHHHKGSDSRQLISLKTHDRLPYRLPWHLLHQATNATDGIATPTVHNRSQTATCCVQPSAAAD